MFKNKSFYRVVLVEKVFDFNESFNELYPLLQKHFPVNKKETHILWEKVYKRGHSYSLKKELNRIRYKLKS